MTVDGELNEMTETMWQLPSTWWQNTAAASALLQVFRNHAIPLLVAGVVGSETQYSVYTGLRLTRGETVFGLQLVT